MADWDRVDVEQGHGYPGVGRPLDGVMLPQYRVLFVRSLSETLPDLPLKLVPEAFQAPAPLLSASVKSKLILDGSWKTFFTLTTAAVLLS